MAHGVLLYYCYVPLDPETTQPELAAWFRHICSENGLRGRVRVAEDGVNVTLGGKWTALLQHIESVKAHPILKCKTIDFKLAESGCDANGVVTQETGFDDLAVRTCRELVTLGPLAQGRADAASNAGQHLTPHQFHQMLQEASTAAPIAAASEPANADASSGTGGGGSASGRQELVKETVLIDARNIYETSIGHFDVAGVPLLDPQTRCFSDLPTWLDRMEPRLKGRRVLMYCTGGVRCERASAYLREKGPGFEDVYQLSGGIQRYLEAFNADGGFFRGKNFVYDDRISVGPGSGPPQQQQQQQQQQHQQYQQQQQEQEQGPVNAGRDATGSTPSRITAGCQAGAVQADVPLSSTSSSCVAAAAVASSSVVGRCVLCSCAWDDYSNRARCSRCRMLVLVCDTCMQQQLRHEEQLQVQCKLCGLQSRRGHSRKARKKAAAERAAAGQPGAGHTDPDTGASSSQGGNNSSKRGPSSIRLPGGGCAAVGAKGQGAEGSDTEASAERRPRILCLHGFRQTGYKLMGRTCGVRKHLDDLADFYFPDAPHLLPHFFKSTSASENTPQAAGVTSAADLEAPPADLWQGDAAAAAATSAIASRALDSEQQPEQEPQQRLVVAPAAHKRAWMIPPELLQPPESAAAAAAGGASNSVTAGVWQPAPEYVDEEQYLKQVEGFDESWKSLQAFIKRHGPFAGVLGFSQGAAVAAVLCALQQQQQQQRQQQGEQGGQSSRDSAVGPEGEKEEVRLGFKFAILASGYRSRCPEHEQLFDAVGPLLIPSLHVFGGSSSVTSTSSSEASAGEGQDRQVSAEESERLAALFEATAGRRLVRHGQGHVLPCKRSIIQELRDFLIDQLQACQ